MIKKVFFFLLIVLIPSLEGMGGEQPFAVYLTWQRDPITTITIQWITSKEEERDDVNYQAIDEEIWHHSTGTHIEMPQDLPYFIHRAELTNLKPDSEYVFQIDDENNQYKFRTMPSDPNAPIRFVVGGDVYHDDLKTLIQMNKRAAETDPMFALVGGDIAYSSHTRPSKKEDARRWFEWLKAWEENMVTSKGYLIPMIPAMGNHDVNGRFFQIPEHAKFFYSLFAFPGPQGYNVLDFGNYLSIIALDTHHTHPIYGVQTDWLSLTLQDRQHVLNTFAIYHVPAFPSVRKFNGKINPAVRKYWVPLFEKFNLTAAFEHHEHAYKRTPLINGVLYIGDGAWGVKNPRKPKKPENNWYLEKTAQQRHVILVNITGNTVLFSAINNEGEVFDKFIKE